MWNRVLSVGCIAYGDLKEKPFECDYLTSGMHSLLLSLAQTISLTNSYHRARSAIDTLPSSVRVSQWVSESVTQLMTQRFAYKCVCGPLHSMHSLCIYSSLFYNVFFFFCIYRMRSNAVRCWPKRTRQMRNWWISGISTICENETTEVIRTKICRIQNHNCIVSVYCHNLYVSVLVFSLCVERKKKNIWRNCYLSLFGVFVESIWSKY